MKSRSVARSNEPFTTPPNGVFRTKKRLAIGLVGYAPTHAWKPNG